MTAPMIRRVFLGAWSAGETKTGVLPMDTANGFKVVTAELWGAGSNGQWNRDTQVGEGGVPAAGLIPLSGIAPYNAGDITGTINEATGAFSLTDNSAGCLTDNVNTYLQYRCEHPTFASDFDIAHMSWGSSAPNPHLVRRYPHASLSDPLTQHGVDFLQYTAVNGGTYGSVYAMLKDPAFYTANAVMQQAVLRDNGMMSGLLHRAGYANRGFYATTKIRFFSDRRPGLTNQIQTTSYGPLGLNDASLPFHSGNPAHTVRPSDMICGVIYPNATYFPDNRWMWWRLISTIVDGDILLELMHAPYAQADNLSPDWVTTMLTYHRVGSGVATVILGGDVMGTPTPLSGNWGVAPWSIPPKKSLFGFYFDGDNPGAGAYACIDSYRALVMPNP